MQKKINHANSFWKKKLDPKTYNITREAGTEYAFSGKYWDYFKKGIYLCVCCGAPLFDSSSKFKSSSGWPSFFKSDYSANICEKRDASHGMIRIEVLCNICNSHLGHVFPDGPEPSGLRYCINSLSLNFVPIE